MTIKMKLSGLLLGVLLTATTAFAGGSCGAGKCGSEMKKEMKCSCDMKDKKDHKCTCESKEKCTCDMKKEMKDSCDMMKKESKGSCGAGKCGAEMKNDAKNEMKDKATSK